MMAKAYISIAGLFRLAGTPGQPRPLLHGLVVTHSYCEPGEEVMQHRPVRRIV